MKGNLAVSTTFPDALPPCCSSPTSGSLSYKQTYTCIKWHTHKIIHGGIVDDNKVLEAAQTSSSGELATSIYTVARCLSRRPRRSLSTDGGKSPGRIGSEENKVPTVYIHNSVHNTGRQDDHLSLGTMCSPKRLSLWILILRAALAGGNGRVSSGPS